VRLAAFVAALTFLASPARADEGPLNSAELPRREPERVYYGWQNIVVGYTGELMIVHGFFSDSPAIMGLGLATYAFGGAVVHGVHGNVGAAVASPFILAGVPLVLTLIIASMRADEALAAPALYVLGAPVIDGALGTMPARDGKTFSVLPSVRRESVGLSVSGAF
jgi:hypothetical protein